MPRTMQTAAGRQAAVVATSSGVSRPPMATTGTGLCCTHQLRLSGPWGCQGMSLVVVGCTGPQAIRLAPQPAARANSQRLCELSPSMMR